MQSANSTEQLRTILGMESFNFLSSCGYTKPTAFTSMDDKEDIVRTVWLHFVLFHPHAELAQLRKGLYNTLQFEVLAIQYSKEIRSLLAASTLFDVTPQYLCDAFVVQYSPNGSNKRTKEEAIVYFWFEYVSDCAEGGDVSLQEILKFLSGSSKIPATGFDTMPKIRFCDDDRLPMVCTCDLTITFPLSMGLLQYENFKNKMNYCILGSYGFGTV